MGIANFLIILSLTRYLLQSFLYPDVLAYIHHKDSTLWLTSTHPNSNFNRWHWICRLLIRYIDWNGKFFLNFGGNSFLVQLTSILRASFSDAIQHLFMTPIKRYMLVLALYWLSDILSKNGENKRYQSISPYGV